MSVLSIDRFTKMQQMRNDNAGREEGRLFLDRGWDDWQTGQQRRRDLGGKTIGPSN
jgi:hypothetical protein